jgi:hypothetical protein
MDPQNSQDGSSSAKSAKIEDDLKVISGPPPQPCPL